MSVICGGVSGGFGMPNIVEITDGSGNTFIGAVTDSEVALDATRDDVKIGKFFAANDGIQEGINTITYRTETASRLILPGEDFSIPLSNYNQYDYTKFQCIIVVFNSDYSTNAESYGITIDDNVFSTTTSEKISSITKNSNTKSIDLNLTNTSDKTYSIRYFTYHEDVEE